MMSAKDLWVTPAQYARLTGQALGLVREELRNGNLPSVEHDGVVLVDVGGLPSGVARRFIDQAEPGHGEVMRAELERRKRFVLVTAPTVLGRRPVRTMGMVSGDAAMGMHVFSDIAQGARNLVGGRSESLQGYLREARETCLAAMREQALAMGASAVVSVRFELTDFVVGKGGMLVMSATGTAVVCEK